MTDAYRDPACIWVPSPNFWPNRNGYSPNFVSETDPAFVVWHTEDCASELVAEDIFKSTSSQRSAHYGERLTADADDQFVDEGDGAWHSGNGWMNENSIGVENEDDGNYNGPRTPTLYLKAMRRCAAISRRRNIPCTRQWHIRHDEVWGVVQKYGQQARGQTSTGCPDSFDLDLVVKGAALILAGNEAAAIALVAPPAVTGKIVDQVVGVNVTGAIYQPADGVEHPWVLSYPLGAKIGDTVTLTPRGDQFAPGIAVTYSQAIKLDNGKWYEFLGGDPAQGICDDELDTSDATHPNGSTPADYRPAPVVVPPPPVTYSVVDPTGKVLALGIADAAAAQVIADKNAKAHPGVAFKVNDSTGKTVYQAFQAPPVVTPPPATLDQLAAGISWYDVVKALLLLVRRLVTGT